MWVEYYNHQPQCRQVAKGVDVRWGEEKGASLVAAELARRGREKKVGVIGPLSAPAWKGIEQKVTLVPLGADYIKLRVMKSDEEIAWMRIGAALSDVGMRTLIASTNFPEHELANAIERSYVGIGGTIGIHFIGSTQMSNPDCCVPRQWQTRRKIEPGDWVFCELTSTWWDYSGQVLRGFTVEAEPTPLYQALHETAVAAFDAITKVIKPGVHSRELIEASSMIEANGFTTYDDLVHGYGGGYFQPILGSKSRPAGHPPDMGAGGKHVHGRPAQRHYEGRKGGRSIRPVRARDEDRLWFIAQHAGRNVQGRANPVVEGTPRALDPAGGITSAATTSRCPPAPAPSPPPVFPPPVPG